MCHPARSRPTIRHGEFVRNRQTGESHARPNVDDVRALCPRELQRLIQAGEEADGSDLGLLDFVEQDGPKLRCRGG